MARVALLRSLVLATVREVGTFPQHASPIAVLAIGEQQIRIGVTPEEARLLGSKLNQTVKLRLAVEEDG